MFALNLVPYMNNKSIWYWYRFFFSLKQHTRKALYKCHNVTNWFEEKNEKFNSSYLVGFYCGKL